MMAKQDYDLIDCSTLGDFVHKTLGLIWYRSFQRLSFFSIIVLGIE